MKAKLLRLKLWWGLNRPRITTLASQAAAFASVSERMDRNKARCIWAAINPVIHDLEKLRANTWDQDKITYIQNWLKANFEIKPEEKENG